MPSVEPVVLDTHIWLDVAFGRGRFTARVLRKLNAAATASFLYIAAITPWEIAMLIRAGKVQVAGPTIDWLTKALHATSTAVAPFDIAMAIDAVELPAWTHADPADRMIVATARHMNALLVSRDTAILDYGIVTKAVRVLEPS